MVAFFPTLRNYEREDMHEEVLNFMIANTCHNEKVGAESSKFTFDLHCVEVEVIARFVGNWEKDDIRYEIVSWDYKSI